MSDYIYIITNELGYIKVGVSKHPEKRVKQLQTGNEHTLSLLFTEEFNCSRNHLLKIEDQIHRTLSLSAEDHRGEWFKLPADKTPQDIQNLITYSRIRFEDDQSYFNTRY